MSLTDNKRATLKKISKNKAILLTLKSAFDKIKAAMPPIYVHATIGKNLHFVKMIKSLLKHVTKQGIRSYHSCKVLM
ncbi:MAG: hypothetical protein ACI8RD_000753 [Bacillariaceae sp.]|jgi:hypothetical protein